MTKLELNNKLAELYGEDGSYEIVNENKYSDSITTLLIDDWNRLMPLTLTHGLSIELDSIVSNDFVKKDYVLVREKLAWVNSDDPVYFKDYESIEDAARFAIAKALVKLAESK